MTRSSLLDSALVDAPSVQPVSALTARFRGRRSCGIWFGRLCGQAHRGQDFLDGVVGLDQGYETQRAFAARTRYGLGSLERRSGPSLATHPHLPPLVCVTQDRRAARISIGHS
jgi:hypothetical protein